MGDDPASRLYVRLKHEACGKVGIGSVERSLPAAATTGDVVNVVRELNRDPQIDGILVQLPLPPQVETSRVLEAMDPAKDVDGFHPCNLGRLMAGSPLFVPATPLGIMHLLHHYRIPLAGRNAVVVGRSIEVGKPLAALLTAADTTVTLCHSKTRDLPALTREAEILVSAQARDKRDKPAAIEWATAGGTPRHGRIVAALIVYGEARLSSGGQTKFGRPCLARGESSGSRCALPHRPPWLRCRPVSPV